MTSILSISAVAVMAILTSICGNFTSSPDACAKQVFDEVLLSNLLYCYDPADVPPPIVVNCTTSFTSSPAVFASSRKYSDCHVSPADVTDPRWYHRKSRRMEPLRPHLQRPNVQLHCIP